MVRIFSVISSTILLLSLFVTGVSAQEAGVTRVFVPTSTGITVIKEGAEQRLIIKDYLGSTRYVDGTARESKVVDQSFYPYGGDSRQENLDKDTDRAFTGHRKLAETGVYHAGARFYNPQLGLFIQADTVEGPHRYGYATNNPISNFDPDGHQSMSSFLDDAAKALAAAAKKLMVSGKITQARAALAESISRDAGEAAAPILQLDTTVPRNIDDVMSALSGVYTAHKGNGRHSLIFNSGDENLRRFLGDLDEHVNSGLADGRMGREQLIEEFVSSRGVNSREGRDAIYAASGGNAYLGQFAVEGAAVACRECAALQQVGFAAQGRDGFMVVGNIGDNEGRHAWYEFKDLVSGQWYMADSTDFSRAPGSRIVPREQGYEELGGVSGLEYYQFVKPNP